MCRWILGFAACFMLHTAFALEVSAIAHPNSTYSGFGEIKFAGRTTLKVPASTPIKIVIESYNGRWDGGLANGYGELRGLYVIQQADNPIYLQLQSTDPAIRSQANQVLERIRDNAKFIGTDPNEAVDTFLGDKAIKIAFNGEFKNGMAMGDGELFTEARKLKGTFYNWLPEGLMTHFFGDSPVISEMYANGLPANGPLLINQYPAGLPDASRRFVGIRTDGKVSGDWYELLWKSSGEEYSTVGIGNTTTVTFKDGSLAQCQYAPLDRTQTADVLDRIRGNVDLELLQITDAQYLRPMTSCMFTAQNGWVFKFGIADKGPFDRKPAPPYSCSDSQGHPGTVTFDINHEMFCNVSYTTTTTTLKWLSKIGREAERIGKQVEKVILWPIETGGKALETTMCDVVQKTPGVDCHVNLSYGKTYEIVDNNAAQQQRQKEDLSRFLKAREHLFESTGPASVKGQWEYTAKSLDKCFQNCVGPSRAFAMLSIEEINSMMSAGFNEDIKKYRLASLTGPNGRIYDIFRPLYPYLRPQLDVDQFHAAMANVWDFSMATPKIENPALAKYIGGVGAAIEAVQMAVDFHTLHVVQQRISWETAKLKGGEVGYYYINVTPSGDVSITRLKSLDQDVYRQEGAKAIKTTIIGIMTSEEIMNYGRVEQETAKRAMEMELDRKLQESLQNAVKY